MDKKAYANNSFYGSRVFLCHEPHQSILIITTSFYTSTQAPSQPMESITWQHFEQTDIRVGTIIEALDFPEARRPAYKLTIDLGLLGIKKSSAQITKHYTREELPGRQVLCVTNLGKKQIGKYLSEVLVTGFADENGDIVLAQPAGKVPNGSKLI